MTDIVEVRSSSSVITAATIQTVVATNKTVEILEVAKQGPPGPRGPGGGGGAAYEHTQSIAMAVWTLAHNLDKYPAVSVCDTLGNFVLADVKYVDRNIVQITHSIPTRGAAYCT